MGKNNAQVNVINSHLRITCQNSTQSYSFGTDSLSDPRCRRISVVSIQQLRLPPACRFSVAIIEGVVSILILCSIIIPGNSRRVFLLSFLCRNRADYTLERAIWAQSVRDSATAQGMYTISQRNIRQGCIPSILCDEFKVDFTAIAVRATTAVTLGTHLGLLLGLLSRLRIEPAESIV